MHKSVAFRIRRNSEYNQTQPNFPNGKNRISSKTVGETGFATLQHGKQGRNDQTRTEKEKEDTRRQGKSRKTQILSHVLARCFESRGARPAEAAAAACTANIFLLVYLHDTENLQRRRRKYIMSKKLALFPWGTKGLAKIG
ncbi:hypothetical protein Trydic_g20086 [Trypoxylus dichotomus]